MTAIFYDGPIKGRAGLLALALQWFFSLYRARSKATPPHEECFLECFLDDDGVAHPQGWANPEPNGRREVSHIKAFACQLSPTGEGTSRLFFLLIGPMPREWMGQRQGLIQLDAAVDS